MLPPEIGAVMGIQTFSCIKIGLWGEKFIFKAVFSFFFSFFFFFFTEVFAFPVISCYLTYINVFHACAN